MYACIGKHKRVLLIAVIYPQMTMIICSFLQHAGLTPTYVNKNLQQHMIFTLKLNGGEIMRTACRQYDSR